MEFNQMNYFCSEETTPALCVASLHKIKHISFDAAGQLLVPTQLVGTSKAPSIDRQVNLKHAE